MKSKRIWISLLLTIFVNILCLPLWTECGYGGFIRTLFNKEARLDLLYAGKITGDGPFQYEVTPKPFFATWMYGSNIHRANLSLRAIGKWQRLSLQLKARRDGKINTVFKGPEIQDEYGAFYSVLVDWRNIQINGKPILPKQGVFSFQKCFVKNLSVKKGDVLHIEAEFRQHHFSIHDFTGLKSGMVWYIITGNLLFFFLVYRLLSYIQGGGIRRVDALFLAIIFPMLFIPMIGISDAVKSVRENRMLAVKPELRDIFKEKSDSGRRYENWFNDHFCARVSLIKLHDVLRNKLSRIIRTERAIYFKEKGYHFSLISNLFCRPPFLQSIVQNLVQLNEFCQQNQIKLYILEVPAKEIINKEFIKENYGFDEKEFLMISRAREAIRTEMRKYQIPYIYPYKALRDAAKSNFVFLNWTHHWTDWGAFVGYRELMKEVRRDFPDIPIVSLNDYRESQSSLVRDVYSRDYRLVRRISEQIYNEDLGTPCNRTFHNYYDHKKGNKMIVKVGKFIKDYTYPDGKYKIMLAGTSQCDNLTQFLPYSAGQTKYIRMNYGQAKEADEFKILKLYKKDILTFKPDILILCISAENLPGLRNLCSTK